MRLNFHKLGRQAVLSKLGLLQTLSFTPATGDNGRLHGRTSDDPKGQIASGFGGIQKQLDWDSSDIGDSSLPVGSGQSKAAERKLQDRRKFRGLDISIENDTGSTRKWHDPNSGEDGKTVFKYPYGYIRLTEGMDGDHVDCFVGPNEEAPEVYVVMSKKAPDFLRDDEQKCMLGFDSAEAAEKAYRAHYDNPKFFGSMKTYSWEEFKEKVLATSAAKSKKLASNELSEPLINRSVFGDSYPDKVPGDALNLPLGSLVGPRTIPGLGVTGPEKVDRAFRFNDINDGTRIMESQGGGSLDGPTI